jgi:DNA-binding CsgD family transcriptional regulator
VESLTTTQLETVLDVAETLAWADTIEAFRRAATRAVGELVECDSVGYNEVDTQAGTTYLAIHPDVDVPAGAFAAMARHALQHPVIAAHRRGNDRVLRISDFLTRAEFRALDLYREIYGPMGVEYQVSFTLPAVEPMVVGLALNRAASDFTAAECLLLERLRPHLAAALRRARLRDPLGQVPLSPRRREIALLVGNGMTNAEIGAELGISAGTVKKQLEHVYAQLGVPNRTALARMTAARAAGPPPAPRV